MAEVNFKPKSKQGKCQGRKTPRQGKQEPSLRKAVLRDITAETNKEDAGFCSSRSDTSI